MCMHASKEESMINGLSGSCDVGGVGLAEIDIAGIDLEVADIRAAQKTANGRGTSGGGIVNSGRSR